MGRPKLILPLEGGGTVISRVVRSLLTGGASAVLVVAPPRTQAGSIELATQAQESGGTVLHLEQPTPDMRATVEAGLDFLAIGAPSFQGVLITPGDTPTIDGSSVARVVECFRADPTRIVVPAFEGRRGHPLLLPWRVALKIPSLPEGVGINQLLVETSEAVSELPLEESEILVDVDTPEDYEPLAPREH